MMHRLIMLFTALLLSGCSIFTPQPDGCDSERYRDYNACLQRQSAEQLGLANDLLRKQYLLYAEKLDQDMRLDGLSEDGARQALAARYAVLATDPASALQCARFAERILCY